MGWKTPVKKINLAKSYSLGHCIFTLAEALADFFTCVCMNVLV